MIQVKRCPWAASDEIFYDYHDKEWGVPEYDSQIMFEFLVLELMQAGLSWRTVLLKRESMRKAFADFIPDKIVRFKQNQIEKILQDPGVIRNKLKVNAVITNAKCYLQLEKEGNSFSDFIWQLTDFQPIKNQWTHQAQMPASTELSDKLSKQLKQYGFKFIGSTICYSFMQAIGMVNDHVQGCDHATTV